MASSPPTLSSRADTRLEMYARTAPHTRNPGPMWPRMRDVPLSSIRGQPGREAEGGADGVLVTDLHEPSNAPRGKTPSDRGQMTHPGSSQTQE